jgi:hypothetical protein
MVVVLKRENGSSAIGDSEHNQREGEDMRQTVTQKFERG